VTKSKEKKSEKNSPQKRAKSVKSTKKISKDKTIIKDLKIELEKNKDTHLRLKAEFDNFRRRKVNEFSNLLQYEGESVIKGFLPIIDDLDRIINSTDSSEKLLKEGIDLVKTKIDKLLTSIDIKPFALRGEEMNPDLHDAMLTQSDKELDDNCIIEVFEKGYTYREKVIRHAKVIVNKK
jgi:molecular chaperone GrpE